MLQLRLEYKFFVALIYAIMLKLNIVLKSIYIYFFNNLHLIYRLSPNNVTNYH